MKKNSELLIAAATTGASAVLFLCACLFVVGAVPLSSLPPWGVWVFGFSVGAGFVAMACARNYGVLIGVVVPGLLLGILGLHWAVTGGDVKRCIALALASAGFWPVLRIGSQMIATDLRTRWKRRWTWRTPSSPLPG